MCTEKRSLSGFHDVADELPVSEQACQLGERIDERTTRDNPLVVACSLRDLTLRSGEIGDGDSAFASRQAH